MAAKLAVAVGTLAFLVVLAGVLLFTVGRDAANQAAGEWLIRQATNDEEYALLTRVGDLNRQNHEHPAFACAFEDGLGDEIPNASEVASAAGMPAGDWTVGETGQKDGVPYVTFYDATGGASDGGAFDWREVNLAGRTLTCLVPL